MTDDICGHPTGDGGECQNPATEGDSCWIESHGGDVSGHGRPSKLEATWDDVMAAAEEGLTLEGIARVAGIGVSTLREWRTENDDFSAALARARARGERDLIQEADAEFILERSFGYVKTEKRELEHSGGLDLSLSDDEQEMIREMYTDE